MADSVWSCKEEFGSVCEGLPADKKHEGKAYCVLHFPSVDKDLARFKEAIEKKLKEEDFDVRGVYFPKAEFRYATFEGQVNVTGATFEGEADFSSANFKKEASFSNVTFKAEANFRHATFERWASFSFVIFEEQVHCYSATFKEEVEFFSATFKGEADFSSATFEGEADFSSATFKEGATFWRTQTSYPRTFVRFRSAVIEKPERFSFHSTNLRPSWFVNVDAQKFDFSDVEWFTSTEGDKLKLEKEIETVWEATSASQSRNTNLRILQKACRQLMNNSEENHDYATANEFHYWSMELLRKEGWWRRLGLIGTLYWLLSGYGERPRRAFLVLAGMWTLFAILYVMVAGSIEHVGQAFLYSLAAMVRLTGVPAMAPLTNLLQPSAPGLFQVLVTFEGILGPLQIGLLAFAIRRKFMR